MRGGLGGPIAKRDDAPYRGGRSRDWLNSVRPGAGGGHRRLHRALGLRVGIGALLIGYYDAGTLRYAGKVGTGFDAATLVALRRRLEPLETEAAPFGEPVKPLPPGTHWVRPELVAQVGFAEWTAAGRMRQPRYLGLRADKPAEAVVRERALA